jgi:hypothetical protein
VEVAVHYKLLIDKVDPLGVQQPGEVVQEEVQALVPRQFHLMYYGQL